jgi:ABC-type nitrate/sulfonate/bicarbonate transport system substrate-binding protein
MRRPARLLHAVGVPGLALAIATLTLTAAPAAAPAAGAPLPLAALAPDAAQQLIPVRFGSPGSISDSGVLIGRALGYFREQGLDVDTTPIQSGSDLIAPLASGELEIGGGTFSIALLNAIQRGVGLRIVADKGNSRQGFQFSQLPIRKDLMDGGEVRQITDLRGRKIAVSATRAGSEAVLAHILNRGGLGIDDVDVQVLGYPDMLQALGNRAIDGAIIIEPFITAALDRGLVGTWEQGYSGDAYGGVYQAGVLIFSGRFAEQTDQARRFMIGYLKGVRAYNDAFAQGQNRAEVVRLLTEQTAVKDPALYDRMEPSYVNPNGWVQVENLKEQQRELAELGLLDGPPVDLDQVIDHRYVENALRVLGRYDE